MCYRFVVIQIVPSCEVFVAMLTLKIASFYSMYGSTGVLFIALKCWGRRPLAEVFVFLMLSTHVNPQSIFPTVIMITFLTVELGFLLWCCACMNHFHVYSQMFSFLKSLFTFGASHARIRKNLRDFRNILLSILISLLSHFHTPF